METITIKGNQITAFTSIEDAWNNAQPNDFWGTGYVLTKNKLFICLSENHELFSYIMDELNWKFI